MQRPTTGIPNGYRGPLSASNIHEGLAPHALFNHQAASKKSFRIRPQKEQELLKNQQSLSSKDIGTDFNNGKFLRVLLYSIIYRYAQICLRAQKVSCCVGE